LGAEARLWLVKVTCVAVCELAALLVQPSTMTPVAVLWGLLLFGLWLRPAQDPLRRTFLRRAVREMARAAEREELDRARRRLDDLRALLAPTPVPPSLTVSLEAALLLAEERHEETARLLERVDRSELSERQRPLLDHSMAWALSHLGEHARAVAAAQRAVAAAKGRERCLVLQTLGVCLFRAGRHRDAVEAFEGARTLDRSRQKKSATLFYFSQALAELGRVDEARAALRKAATARNRWGARARTELARRSAPFR